jgi:hypothetical protein
VVTRFREWLEDASRALFWFALIGAIVLFASSEGLTFLYTTF